MAQPVVLFLDGEEPNAALVRRHLTKHENTLVIATDGAAHYAMHHGIRLDAIVGDMDSLTKSAMDFYSGQGTKIVAIAEQYSNDFEKALRYIASITSDASICVLGISGRRTDHVLTNFSVLQRFTKEFDEIIAYDETLVHRFLTTKNNTIQLDLLRSMIVSLTPLPKAEGVTTQGLLYPLDNATMLFGENEGLSNRVASDNGVTISLSSGALLVSHMF